MFPTKPLLNASLLSSLVLIACTSPAIAETPEEKGLAIAKEMGAPFELVEEVFVDFSAEGQDGGERVGDFLAALGEAGFEFFEGLGQKGHVGWVSCDSFGGVVLFQRLVVTRGKLSRFGSVRPCKKRKGIIVSRL